MQPFLEELAARQLPDSFPTTVGCLRVPSMPNILPRRYSVVLTDEETVVANFIDWDLNDEDTEDLSYEDLASWMEGSPS